MDSYKIINATELDNSLEAISSQLRRIRSKDSLEQYSFPEDIQSELEEIEVNKSNNINFSLMGNNSTIFQLRTAIVSPTIFENYSDNTKINISHSLGDSIQVNLNTEKDSSSVATYTVSGLSKKEITEQLNLNEGTGIVSIDVPAGECYIPGGNQTKTYSLNKIGSNNILFNLNNSTGKLTASIPNSGFIRTGGIENSFELNKIENNNISFNFNDTTGIVTASISNSGFITSEGITNTYSGIKKINGFSIFEINEDGIISVAVDSGFILKEGISDRIELETLTEINDMKFKDGNYIISIPRQVFIPEELTYEITGQTLDSIYKTEDEDNNIIIHIPSGYYSEDLEINLDEIELRQEESFEEENGE